MPATPRLLLPAGLPLPASQTPLLLPFHLVDGSAVRVRPCGRGSLLLEEDEPVAVGVTEYELPVARRLHLRLAGRRHPSRHHGAVEVLDVVDLDVDVEPRPLAGKLCLLPQLGVGNLILRDQGHEEPVDVERHLSWLLLASSKADRLVELGRLGEVIYVAGESGDAVYLHRVFSWWCRLTGSAAR